MLHRFRTAPAVGVLGLGLLSGCGGGDDLGAYCESLESLQDDLSFDEGDIGTLGDARSQLEEVVDAAPGAVEEDWQQLDSFFDDVFAAFEDAGIDPEELSDLSAESLPEDVDMGALQEAMLSLEEDIDQEAFDEATENIEQHAEDECGLDLSAP